MLKGSVYDEVSLRMWRDKEFIKHSQYTHAKYWTSCEKSLPTLWRFSSGVTQSANEAGVAVGMITKIPDSKVWLSLKPKNSFHEMSQIYVISVYSSKKKQPTERHEKQCHYDVKL